MSERFMPFDAARRVTDLQDAALLLEAAFDEADSDAAGVARALGIIARSGHLSELAWRTGLTREGLSKALAADSP